MADPPPVTAAADAIAEFAIQGVARLSDVLPAATLAEMRAAWHPVREQFNSRYGPDCMGPALDGAYSGKGPCRHQISPLPLAPPFLGSFSDSAASGDCGCQPRHNHNQLQQLCCFLEDPRVVDFLEGVLGPGYQCAGFGCNTNYPGSAYQRWHIDGLGGQELRRWVSVQWVIDDNAANGPLEYLPATQHVPASFSQLVGFPFGNASGSGGGSADDEKNLQLETHFNYDKKGTSTSGDEGEDGSDDGRPLLSAIDRLVSAPGPAGVETGEVGGLQGYLSTDVGRRWSDGHLGPLRQDGATRAGFVPVPMLVRPGELWFRDNAVYHRGTPNRGAQPRDLFHMYVHAKNEENDNGALTARGPGRGNGRGGSATQFIPAAWWARLSPGAKQVFKPFRVAEVTAVTAERAAVDAWPEEDALWLADGGSAVARL
jgi:hypothetical protein